MTLKDALTYCESFIKMSHISGAYSNKDSQVMIDAVQEICDYANLKLYEESKVIADNLLKG